MFSLFSRVAKKIRQSTLFELHDIEKLELKLLFLLHFHTEIKICKIDFRIVSLISLMKKRPQIKFSGQKFSVENSSIVFYIQETNISSFSVNIFGSKNGHLSCNIIIGRYFFIFSKKNFSIRWFFKVESVKYAAELGKLIKYSKNLGEMKKILQFLLLGF